MARNDQLDLFDRDEPDEVIENRPTPVYRADREKVRAELHKILAAARPMTKPPSCAPRSRRSWRGWRRPDPAATAGLGFIARLVQQPQAWFIARKQPQAWFIAHLGQQPEARFIARLGQQPQSWFIARLGQSP